MKALHIIAFVILVIGGLLWAVAALSGGWMIDSVLGSGLAKVIYVLVGLAALLEIFTHKKNCKTCEAKPAGM